MRLLIFTQKVDRSDAVLGFMHRWIEEFAVQYEQVTVICLYKGEFDLSANVRVFSLGKEQGVGRLRYLINFYRLIFREYKNYDRVFVHMNPIYVILGGVFWRLLGKRVGLWYAHGHVSFGLRLAEKIAHIIFTSTQSGFRLLSDKINIIGQGIDTDYFVPSIKKQDNIYRIVVVGRISPVKDYETLISSIELFVKKKVKVLVSIIGGVGLPEQEVYLQELKKIVFEKQLESIITFEGPISNDKILPFLQESDLFVNTSLTGSLDKAILEAMSCAVPVLTCNEALKEVLGIYVERLMFPKKDFFYLSEKITENYLLDSSERIRLGLNLRSIVIENHSLAGFVKKISLKL